jgi:alpha-tubulin suppressor-like RCC1 family protein
MVLPILASVSGMPCNRKPSKIAAFDGVTFESITAGRSHTCALDSQGRGWCWGEGLMGQIGPNTPDTCGSGGADYPCSLEPVLVADTPIFSSLAAGGSHTCGIERTTGRLYCWGANRLGQLGTGSINGPEECRSNTACSRTPIPVAGGAAYSSLASGGRDHTYALRTDGRIYCWGFRAYGN